jgi:hypothetical protein
MTSGFALGCDETHKIMPSGRKIPPAAAPSRGPREPLAGSARTGPIARMWLKVEGHAAQIIA